MSRIKIVTGHFGSGKTEIALNLAKNLVPSVIVDMDTVNPYFRTADAAEEIRKSGVRVITPRYANTNVDMPTLPSEILSVFNTDENAVLDVGGDDDGAYALGAYHNYLTRETPDMYFVICATRPLQSNTDEVLELMKNVEFASRLKITHLINNTHLSVFTDTDTVLYGQSLCEEVSRKSGIPIFCTTVREDLKNKIMPLVNNPVYGLKLYLNLPFEQPTDN